MHPMFSGEEPCNLQISGHGICTGIHMLMPNQDWSEKEIALFPLDSPLRTPLVVNPSIALSLQHVEQRLTTVPVERGRCSRWQLAHVGFERFQTWEPKVGRSIPAIASRMDRMMHELLYEEPILRWISMGMHERVQRSFVIAYLRHIDSIP